MIKEVKLFMFEECPYCHGKSSPKSLPNMRSTRKLLPSSLMRKESGHGKVVR